MEKGGPAKKNCEVACIGCSKCEKECKFDAITIDSFLAYIDFSKCTLCRKCVDVCPTNAIHEINFKPRKPRPEKAAGTVPRKPAPKSAPGKVAEKKETNVAVAEKPEEPEKKDSTNNNNKE